MDRLAALSRAFSCVVHNTSYSYAQCRFASCTPRGRGRREDCPVPCATIGPTHALIHRTRESHIRLPDRVVTRADTPPSLFSSLQCEPRRRNVQQVPM
ncbi:hypothetical protein VFPFJ_01050 [Purpureocillium lilacinum]|uniref:Uncharacterized protein n=1 Tax=Purpureocillium lilacinum TaxID=33203 RepID=A0A179HZG7_PURLI|nr:hypothetical protein VFPFJ_01050 [Purpureocillium lilacinum]OAQ94941.1 hypothetical protein VFPFJ_01050 [Purpureocillium lilacinum]